MKSITALEIKCMDVISKPGISSLWLVNDVHKTPDGQVRIEYLDNMFMPKALFFGASEHLILVDNMGDSK